MQALEGKILLLFDPMKVANCEIRSDTEKSSWLFMSLYLTKEKKHLTLRKVLQL